jgi:hypothetical protein
MWASSGPSTLKLNPKNLNHKTLNPDNLLGPLGGISRKRLKIQINLKKNLLDPLGGVGRRRFASSHLGHELNVVLTVVASLKCVESVCVREREREGQGGGRRGGEEGRRGQGGM